MRQRSSSHPAHQSKAIINDAAGRLHVAPSALSSALKQARIDQIDSAVKAGRLTKQQGDALKAQIDKGQMPLVGGPAYGFGFRGHDFGGHGFGFGFGHPGGLFGAGSTAVTSYLGVTQAQLRSALASGKSLATIAKAHGKTSAGLVAAIVATTKSELDKAVAAKHLTAAQEKAILARTQTFITDFVNGKAPALGHGPGFGHDPGFGGHGFGFGFGHPGGLFGAGSTAVTSYLGVTQAQLRSALASGKSLARSRRRTARLPPAWSRRSSRPRRASWTRRWPRST